MTHPPPDTADITTCRRCKAYVRIITMCGGTKLAVDAWHDGGRVIAYYDPELGRYVGGWWLGHNWLLVDVNPGARRHRPHSDHCH